MNKHIQSESVCIRFILHHRIWVLAAFLLITAFLGCQLPTISISKEVNVLFPAHHPNMVLVKKFNKMLATPDKLICILEVKKGDIYTPDALSKIQALTRAVLQLPGCDASDIKSITETSVKHMEATAWGVETNPVIFPDFPETTQEFQRLRQRVETDAGIRGVYVSYDGTAATIMAKWKKGDKLGLLHEDLQKIARTHTDDNFMVHFAGAPALGAHLIHLTGQFKTAGLWMAAGLILLLALFLRSVTGVVLAFASLVLSCVWALGFAAAVSVPLSFLAIVWVLFFIAVTTGMSAFCFRYYKACAKHVLEKSDALKTAFGTLFAPVTAGFILTGLCALTLSLSDPALLCQTGYLGAFFAVTGGVIVLVFNPTLLSFLPRQKPCTPLFRSSPGISRVTAILIMTAIIAGGVFSTRQLAVGDNEPGSAFFFPDHPYSVGFSFFNEKFIGGYNMTIMAEGRQEGVLNDFQTMDLIGQFRHYLENETDARACISITMMMKLLARLYHEGNPKWALIPEDEQARSALGGAIKMGGTAGQWMDDTWTNASIQAMYGSDDHLLIKERTAKARQFIKAHPSDRVDFRVCAGFLSVIEAMDDAGAKAFWQSIWMAAGLTLIAGLLVFRRPVPVFASLAATITTQAAALTFMAAQGICISIHMVPVAPLCLGWCGMLAICLLALMGKNRAVFTGLKSRAFVGQVIVPLTALSLVPAAMLLPWALTGFKFMAESAQLIVFFTLAQFVTLSITLFCLADLNSSSSAVNKNYT